MKLNKCFHSSRWTLYRKYTSSNNITAIQSFIFNLDLSILVGIRYRGQSVGNSVVVHYATSMQFTVLDFVSLLLCPELDISGNSEFGWLVKKGVNEINVFNSRFDRGLLLRIFSAQTNLYVSFLVRERNELMSYEKLNGKCKKCIDQVLTK